MGQSALRLHTVRIGIVPTSFRCCILVGAVTTYPAMTFCDFIFSTVLMNCSSVGLLLSAVEWMTKLPLRDQFGLHNI